KAEPVLRQAQERRPGDFWTNFHLASFLVKESRPSTAIGYYRAALAVRPNTTAVYNNLGLALGDQNDLPGAIAAFKKAIEIDPKYSDAYRNLGVALSAQNDLPGAIAAYKKAIEINPK